MDIKNKTIDPAIENEYISIPIIFNKAFTEKSNTRKIKIDDKITFLASIMLLFVFRLNISMMLNNIMKQETNEFINSIL